MEKLGDREYAFHLSAGAPFVPESGKGVNQVYAQAVKKGHRREKFCFTVLNKDKPPLQMPNPPITKIGCFMP
jgi:hypothetical protein